MRNLTIVNTSVLCRCRHNTELLTVVTRHQDDHTRSIAFLGDQDADGGSPPAFDRICATTRATAALAAAR